MNSENIVCGHDVPGVCPQCYPAESRGMGSRKASLAIAWLETIERQQPGARLETIKKMAADAIDACRAIKS
jgi:hypothetical protein